MRAHDKIRVAYRSFLGFAVATIAAAPTASRATVIISSNPTQNMSCSGGLCEPTATNAVLNFADLENLLASGDVTVTTTGSGVQADNIDVKSPFGWSSANSLTLDAEQSIMIDKTIAVAGSGGAALNGSLLFGQKGRLQFASISSSLAINGTAYALMNNIASLASAIASDPSGSYAFANNYDASQDGTYSAAPIQTVFTGTFDGLGNTIAHLSIDHTGSRTGVGLFLDVLQPGMVQHVRLTHADITGTDAGEGDEIGILAGGGIGASFFQDFVSGKINLRGMLGLAGGLIANTASSSIRDCSADVIISSRKAKGGAETGGLVGANSSSITESFALGSVSVEKYGHAGGLVGVNSDVVANSYSTGAVSGDGHAKVGGLIGDNRSDGVQAVYSAGAVSGEGSTQVGGFAGSNAPRLSDSYWDTDTSGTTRAVGKGNRRGITGLTTQELQAGLPAGFDPSVWNEKSNINNGLPYLLANPPPK